MLSWLRLLCAFFALGNAWVAYSGLCLSRNYLKAWKIGVPIRIIPVDHLKKPWLLVDRHVTSLVRRLPGRLGKNNFTRFNYRGWHEHDGLRSHDEMGEAFVLVTPSHIWLYLANPVSLMDMYRRGGDFPRWTEITKMLDVFGGPNIATASGEQWKKHRKMINSSLNEQCNISVWSEAAILGEEMARYWAGKGVITSIGEDTRTVSLHVLSKACFGQSFAFEGHDERSVASPAASFRLSLLTIMENTLLLLALGPHFFMYSSLPLPSSWRTLGDACGKFKGYMTYLYNQKLHALTSGPQSHRDSTLMASLVRSSQKMEDGSCLTADEIYGTLFVVSFTGHDTTAHLLTYAIFYLAAYPSVQDWLSRELIRVLGDRPSDEWDYHTDFPQLKRCMAILYETLRLKTPVPEVKWTSENPQSLRVDERTLTIPPKTLVIPSYIYVQRHPHFWGPDAQDWSPARWIGDSNVRHAGLTLLTAQGDEQMGRSDRSNELGQIDSADGEVLLSPPSRGNFLGWSEGSRDCPGKRFSQVEWVAILAALFRDWQVQPRLQENETLAEEQVRILDFIERNTDYGGLLLQLMHPERLPLVWSRRT
ncbi:cytochrome P450 [Xylariaceae sp. FL0662B]|nr:cytochrome P450 [Xylariaceae sp. FL0662B]